MRENIITGAGFASVFGGAAAVAIGSTTGKKYKKVMSECVFLQKFQLQLQPSRMCLFFLDVGQGLL